MTDSDPVRSEVHPVPRREVVEPPEPGLDDRLLFLAAHHLLVGLAPCSRERAVVALLSISEQFDLTPADLARLFLDGLESHGDPVVARVLALARGNEAIATTPDPAALLLTVRPVGGHRPGLQVTGELDDFTAPVMRAATITALSVLTAFPVISDSGFWLDLSGLTFCDVRGLRALADLHRQVISTGADVHVIRAKAGGPNVLFAIAADQGWLDRVFTLPGYPDPRQLPSQAPAA